MEAVQPVFSNLTVRPWTLNRPESQKLNELRINRYFSQIENCTSWRDVHSFMFSGDPATFNFVRNQLMRLLGVKQKRKCKKKNKKERQFERLL